MQNNVKKFSYYIYRYITVDEDAGRALFYTFVTSRSAPDTDPLVRATPPISGLRTNQQQLTQIALPPPFLHAGHVAEWWARVLLHWRRSNERARAVLPYTWRRDTQI